MFDASEKPPKVVVIGGGLSGLTTAYRLLQKGMDVRLYEARGRVGGRILTIKIGNRIGELGGQFISDGGEAENIRRLIYECGLELEERKVDRIFSYFNGTELISPQQLFGQQRFQPDVLKAQLDSIFPKSRNMKDVFDAVLDREDPLYHVIATMMAAYEGDSIEKLSSLYVNTFYHMLLGGLSTAYQENEENIFDVSTIRGGMAQLCEKMADMLGRRLHLNMPLEKVLKEKTGYTLVFKDQQVINADILVLTMPCSVYDSIFFEKNVIPTEKLETIKNVRYGTNAKILIPFSKTPIKKIRLINDRAACALDEGLLTLYYSLDAAKFSEETILDTYKHERLMLEKVCGDFCPPLVSPVVAKDKSFHIYNCPVGYSWPNDPYTKGSYAYIAAGQEILLTSLLDIQEEKVKTLFAPINQTLYFAGEHTSLLFEYAGTMEAACESGERTARMILNSRKFNIFQR